MLTAFVKMPCIRSRGRTPAERKFWESGDDDDKSPRETKGVSPRKNKGFFIKILRIDEFREN
jgi:hypothetical protein